jgi:DNA repair protein SbcC/Rad50
LQKNFITLQEQRYALLGNQDPLAEENKLLENKKHIEATLQNAFAQEHHSAGNCRVMRQNIEERKQTMESRKGLLETTLFEFNKALQQAGFAHEQEYLACLLDKEQLDQIRQEAQQLAQQSMKLEASYNEKQHILQNLQQQNFTEQGEPELQVALQTVSEQIAHIQQQKGAFIHRWQEQLQKKSSLKHLNAKWEAQTKVRDLWASLNKLIGSADGNKYRRFVQGLTFRQLLEHANIQLQRMSDRYVLMPDSEEPLELNVCDQDQAGEVRSVKNLSGGESFLVSLALALGLSYMSGGSGIPSSLFLDEGFGTLDESTLETALEALSGLQQEGKLIGIISHVGALKERIVTQIKVNRRTGGRSTLSGPGVMGK